ncbi:hypothetical protein ACN4EG_04350 [Alkalinema pantanalense CENA528]|uniref:hypothetical protein n=1 Tax=Alkalinema pantanalense TaxID=1620705 RepID=UPI003D6E8DF7
MGDEFFDEGFVAAGVGDENVVFADPVGGLDGVWGDGLAHGAIADQVQEFPQYSKGKLGGWKSLINLQGGVFQGPVRSDQSG